MINKIIPFLLFVSWCTLLHSQNMVVDGVTFSADGKTLIEYPEDKTDEEYVVPEGTEVIGKGAFCYAKLHHVVLPFSLKEIGDGAFWQCYYLESVTWGNFPSKIGREIFTESMVENFYVLDGANCTAIDGVLFTLDKKRLLRYPPMGRGFYDEEYHTEYVVPENTEIISSFAFESAWLYTITLPSTLKVIEEGAFWVLARVPTKAAESIPGISDYELIYRRMDRVACKAVIPPVLIGTPFAYPLHTQLFVPEESFNAYCYADGWTKFGYVNDQSNPASVNMLDFSDLKITSDGDHLNITSEQIVSVVRLYTLNGVLLADEAVNNYSCDIKLRDSLQELLILEVVYDSGKIRRIKLYK